MQKKSLDKLSLRFFNDLTCQSISVFIFLLVFLSLQTLTNSGLRTCLRVAENEIYQPTFTPEKNHCEGWLCWDSQLTFYHKYKINRIVNSFRNNLAANITNMNRVTWHWTLEQEALRASASCDRNDLEIYYELRNIEGLGTSLRCENACMSKVMTHNPTQDFFVKVLPALLPRNFLHDFDERGNFRRANAAYFGCSLVVRSILSTSKAHEDMFHFVCVYCTNENKMETIYKRTPNDKHNCPSNSVYGGDPRYPRLCNVMNRHDLPLCPPLDPCPDDVSRSEVWLSPSPGRKIQLIMVETTNGPVLFVNETNIGEYNKEGKPSFTTQLAFMDYRGIFLNYTSSYPPIPKHAYKFSGKETKIFNDFVTIITGGNLTIVAPVITHPGIIYSPQKAIEDFLDAPCCFPLFILSLIPTIVLAALIWYTLRSFF